MNDETNVKEKILEFIKNRSEINETTATRHIHRRFGIVEEEIEKILEELFDDNKLKKIYDEEYQENRFKI
jgi:predicted HTH transcriptional regulator